MFCGAKRCQNTAWSAEPWFRDSSLSVFRELRQTQALIVVGRVGDVPRRGEQQERVALEVLDDLGVARQLEALDVKVLLVVLDPTDMLRRRFSRMISTLYSFFRRYSSTSNWSTPTTPTMTDSQPAFGSRKI